MITPDEQKIVDAVLSALHDIGVLSVQSDYAHTTKHLFPKAELLRRIDSNIEAVLENKGPMNLERPEFDRG